jgi:hypothetical protein
LEEEEEEILHKGGNLTGSMVGRRRVLTTWAVGEAWERFSIARQQVVEKAFSVVGLSLPIDGSGDGEISIKGIDLGQLVEGLKDWQKGGIIDDEEDGIELAEREDDLDIFFEDNAPY